jgi:spore maturation protein CgeB
MNDGKDQDVTQGTQNGMRGTNEKLDIVILGLSITSSWGNGHATTFRGLVRALAERGHQVHFLERDVPWYADNRDLANPPYCKTSLYGSLEELRDRFEAQVRSADLVIVGSYVPDGIDVGRWVQATAKRTAFYDIDTPATLAALEAGTCAYLSRELIPGYHLYLSFTGGPTLDRLERTYGAQRARAFYCSFDPESYFPEPQPFSWELGYMGTYSADRQPTVDRLLVEPARRLGDRRFVVAGPMYPEGLEWPSNVDRIYHLSPAEHRSFYCRQRFTLNVTRRDMIAAGYSPSVRLFEAAACGVPIISDHWAGIETIFAPGREILIARSPEDTMRALAAFGDEEAQRLGQRARKRVLAEHTALHRAEQLEGYFAEIAAGGAGRSAPRARAATQAGA